MSATARKKVVVIGGGITGLVAARRLRMLAPQVDVVLLEASDRIGGKILTHDVAGVPVEAGADWFLTRQSAALDLCNELGLGDRLVQPQRTGAYIWSGDRLRRLPPGLVRGIPTKPFSAVRTRSLSPLGALRALAEVLAPRPVTGEDVAIGPLVRRRFGKEVMERLVDPMLAASRSGSADEMSLAAAAPELDNAVRSHRSLLLGLRDAPPPQTSTPPFLGLRGGMTQLVEALAGELRGAEVRLKARVLRIEKRVHRFVVKLGDNELAADAVIAAVPAHAASDVLLSIDVALSNDLDRIHYAPAIVLTLVYPVGAGAPPREGSGLLVPSSENRLLTACAWFSEKWEHARPSDGSTVLRCFVGRADAVTMSDEEIEGEVVREVRRALRLAGPPIETRITRWDAALPVYGVGHPDLVDRIERRSEQHPGLILVGAGYRGSGLPDCILQGTRAAEDTVRRLGVDVG